MIEEGRIVFRFDTFGSEAFWGETLQLYKAISGAKNGGIGGGVSPKTALSVGLKVDADALPNSLRQQIKAGKVDLDDPATTLALLKLNSVVGVTGFFDKTGSLTSMGLQCAFCHSTVDDSLTPGIGKRLDGWANRDLNVGLIVSLAPNLTPFADLLGVDVATVKKVLTSWGPGRFDSLARQGRQSLPAGRQTSGDAHSSRLRPRRRKPVYLDGLRLRHVLERLRRRDRAARLGDFLRRAVQRPRTVPRIREESLWQHARNA